jgi:hypothetical protein
MCDYQSVEDISNNVIKKFEEIKLVIHEPNGDSGKSVLGKIDEKFDYLGYQFKGGLISPFVVRSYKVLRLNINVKSIHQMFNMSI